MTNKKILTLISLLLLVSFLMVGCMLPKQNLPPEITSTPVTTATVGVDYTYNVVATDPNAEDVLTYSLNDEPSGMDINATSGKITWTPTAVESVVFTVVVTDEGGLFDDQEVAITVSEFLVELIKIEVDPETVTVCIPLLKGLTETFTVTATYNDDTTKVVTSDCVYGVDDTSIATVSAGNVTALKVGTATISISYTEGDITKGATLNVIVEGTITVRWLEDAVRFYPDDTYWDSWPNGVVPDVKYGVPATLILTGGGYHFADVKHFYSVSDPPTDYEGSMVIDGIGQLSGDTTYTSASSTLTIKEHFEGDVEIIIYGEEEIVEDHDGTMVGTYTQWAYAFWEGTEEEMYYDKAVLAPEQGPDWWFIGYTIYIVHGEEPTTP